MEAVELLKRYSNHRAAAGDEEELRAAIRGDVKETVDDVSVNPLGNLTAVRRGKDGEKSILVTAHMDEVAFMVKAVEKSGLIRMYAVGGISPKVLVGNQVLVGRDRKPGVIAYRSYHLMTPQERKKVPEIKELAIDVGAGSSEEVRDVGPGDYAYFMSEFFAQGDCYFGKAFDDRAGCAALTWLLGEYGGETRPEVTVVATYTAQEEVGLRGGQTAGFGLRNVLFNLNLEGTTCSDRELKTSYTPITVSGAGPAITFMDRTSVTNRKLFEFVTGVAQKRGIPYQLKKGVAGGTDAGAVALTGEGIPAVTISLPIRYIHAPWGIANRSDFDNYLALADAIVRESPGFGARGAKT